MRGGRAEEKTTENGGEREGEGPRKRVKGRGLAMRLRRGKQLQRDGETRKYPKAEEEVEGVPWQGGGQRPHRAHPPWATRGPPPSDTKLGHDNK